MAAAARSVSTLLFLLCLYVIVCSSEENFGDIFGENFHEKLRRARVNATATRETWHNNALRVRDQLDLAWGDFDGVRNSIAQIARRLKHATLREENELASRLGLELHHHSLYMRESVTRLQSSIDQFVRDHYRIKLLNTTDLYHVAETN